MPIEGRLAAIVGTPAIYAIAIGAIGASIYITLGIVADRALGLTPIAYVVAGLFFVVTMLTYVEGNSLHPERGGASTFARYAFDELWSFIAGWGIVLDYLIVMALCAFAIPDYLAAFWGHAGDAGVEHAIAAAVIVWAVVVNLRGLRADQARPGAPARRCERRCSCWPSSASASRASGTGRRSPRASSSVSTRSGTTWRSRAVVAGLALTGPRGGLRRRGRDQAEPQADVARDRRQLGDGVPDPDRRLAGGADGAARSSAG